MTKRRALARVLIWTAVLSLLCGSLLLNGCIMRDISRNAGDYVGDMLPERGDSYGKRVVVVPFSSGVKKLSPLAQDLTLHLTNSIKGDSTYTLIPFKQLAAQMSEAAKRVSLSEAMITAGRYMGINAIVTGAVTDLALRYRLTGLYGIRENTPFLILEAQLRLADPVTGVVFSEKAVFEELEIEEFEAHNIRMGQEMDPAKVAKLLQEIKPEAAEWLEDELDDLKWTGVILRVEGQRALVTVGQDTGFGTGDELAVISQGERLKSGTGQQVYIPGQILGYLRLTEIDKWTSWAELIPQEPEDEEEEETETQGEVDAEAADREKSQDIKVGAQKAKASGNDSQVVRLPDGMVLPPVEMGQVVRPD